MNVRIQSNPITDGSYVSISGVCRCRTLNKKPGIGELSGKEFATEGGAAAVGRDSRNHLI